MAIPVPKTEFHEEVLEFLATAPSSEQIIAYKVPQELDDRLHFLLDKNSSTWLTEEERVELDGFLWLNRFLMRLKAKTRQKSANQS